MWTGVAGGGGILGMYLSAVLVDVASWRWLFVLPVVLVAVAAVMALRTVPDSREASPHRFDTAGSLASVVAAVGLIFVLHEGPQRGWTAPVTLLSLLVGVAGAAGFVAWELRRPAPLLDIRLFRSRGLAGGAVTLLVVFGVQAGIFVVLFPYFQAVLGWSGLRSTLALMPMALLMMFASGLAPRVAARIGARATMASGIFLGGAGLALMATSVSVDGGYRSVLPGMLAMGLGMGLTMTPSTEAITTALPRARQGVASALNDVTREFGTALGVALLGAVLSAGYRDAVDARLDAVPDAATGSAREGIANALATAGGPHGQALIRAAQESFVEGWQQAMWAGAGVMTALFVYVVAFGPGAAPAPGTSGRRSGGGRGQGLLDPAAQRRGRCGTRLAGDDLAVLDDHQRRHGPHVEAPRQRRRRVDVDLDQLHRPGELRGDLFQGRAHRPARAAPLGPQVDQDRGGGALGDLGERVVAGVDDPRHPGAAAATGRGARRRGRDPVALAAGRARHDVARHLSLLTFVRPHCS